VGLVSDVRYIITNLRVFVIEWFLMLSFFCLKLGNNYPNKLENSN